MILRLLTGFVLLCTGFLSADSFLESGTKPEMLAEVGAGEGPAWHPELGLLTSHDGHIYQRDPSGKQSIYRENAGTNGLLFDREGRLVLCEPVQRRVTRLEKDGNLSVLTDNFLGKKYNQPNDLTIDSKGRIYFTDPRYGSREGMEILDERGDPIEGVFRIDSEGNVKMVIGQEVDRPNGIIITPDDKTMYVADNNNDELTGARKLWRFALSEGEVLLSSQTLVYDWKTTRGPDGMKLDQKGNLYVAAGINKPNPPAETAEKPTAGIYIFSPEGKLVEMIPIPRDETTNCAFGDPDLKSLFVTAGGTLWKIRLKNPGRVLFPPQQ